MPLREDDVAPRTRVPDSRTLIQVGGFVLAIAATLAVFLSDDPQFLRLAVLGIAWAFVLATFAAGRRSTDRVAARAREAELRRAYEAELEREVAARREFELELEAELRRDAEGTVRGELDALRSDLGGLTDLRADIARVAALGTDIAALSSLRDEVARIAALRDDVAALSSLRQDLGQLAELRADMGRLRQELTEQLSSEMLIERIVMRTQASRLSTDLHEAPGRTIDAATRWPDDSPPRELTGGWPAVRLDEPGGTRQFEQVRMERPAARPPVPPPSVAAAFSPPAPPVARPVTSPSWRPGEEPEPQHARPWEMPATATWDSLPAPSWEAPATSSWAPADTGSRLVPPGGARADDTPVWSATADASHAGDRSGRPAHHGAEPVPSTTAFPMAPRAGTPRGGDVPPTAATLVPAPPLPASEPPPSPLEWLAARSLIGAEPTSFRPEVPPRRRRGDEGPADPAVAPVTQRSAVPANPQIRVDDRGAYRVAVPAVPADPPAERSGSPAQEKGLADILAENGVSPSVGGRRRRRYRDEDEPDDVLARVLGTN